MAGVADDPHVLGPGLLPTPFTADEIRAGCPDGRLIRMQLEENGTVVGYRTNRFHGVDVEGASVESRRFDAGGAPAGEPETARVPWLGFQRHAAFEATRTTCLPEVIETPLGRLDCLRYTTRDDDGSIGDYWFALTLPGMPIRYRSLEGDRVTTEVIVIENLMP
jgi:hypothetical protein